MSPRRTKPKLEHEDSSVKFLLEEYRNIAATHDHLRDVINRMFYYFLLLAAVPFTVAAIIFRDIEFNILSLPPSMAFLFLIIGFGILCLSLATISGRYRQNQYAKTVNLIRGYFAAKDSDIEPYLFLPISDSIPKTTNLGHVFWYLLLMTVMGGSYLSLGVLSLLSNEWFIGLAGFILYVLILGLFDWLIRRSYSKLNRKAVAPKQNIAGEG